MVISGGEVSIIKEGILRILPRPPQSFTLIVHVLYVPSKSGSKVTVLLPILAEMCIIDEHGQPYAILHAASEENV